MKANNLCVDDDEKIMGKNFPKVVSELSPLKMAIFCWIADILPWLKSSNK